MGQMTYAGATQYDIDDRMLAHLVLVLAAKLRRQEGFMLLWDVENRYGGGRNMVWIGPGIPLEFKFSGSRPADISRYWVETMLEMSNSAQGLRLVSEEEALTMHRQNNADPR